MQAMPTTKDVRRVRKQAEAGVAVTFDAVKGPLFAVLGAVEVATQTIADALGKARSEVTSRPDRRPAPTELRKLAETCGEAVQEAYSSLVERGEEIFDEFRSQPLVKGALESVESGVDTAQERLEVVVRDLNSATADLRYRFARTSRSVGEEVARDTQRATTVVAQQVQEAADEVAGAVTEAGEEAAGAVTEAGEEAAAATRDVTQRAAHQASPPPVPITRKPDGNSPSLS